MKAPVNADSHVARKVGLIVNERITKSFKYAIKDSEAGIISIMAEQKNTLELVVKDNGTGMPASKNTKSYGMKLIKGLSNELDG